MKLLIIAQKIDINDDILGFFYRWLEKMAERVDEIYVIVNFVGEHNFPLNVKIFSLGKEKGYSKIRRYFLFYKYIFRILSKTNGVFFHMCPEYVIAAGLLPKILRKKTLFWYVHKKTGFRLWLAEKLVDKIFTASKKSFRLSSKKVDIVGHGVDVNKFQINTKYKIPNNKYRVITAGRISRIKNLDILIEAGRILKNKFFRNFEILIAGKPITKEDEIYFDELKKSIEKQGLNDTIAFIGSVAYPQIPEFYQKGDLFINLSDTGSVDKAILEAMASNLAVLTSNEAFKEILPAKYLTLKNPEEIADKIISLSQEKSDPILREYVAQNHNLDNLIEKIAAFYEK